MRFRTMAYAGGIYLILSVFSLSLASGDPLVINYQSQTMTLGSSQNLSVSGGCPPYNWTVSGGGTLTPSGGDNSSAVLAAPISNPNCTNNPTIIVTDSCRQTAELKVAITNGTNDLAFGIFDIRRVPSVCPYCNVSTVLTRYKCSGAVYESMDLYGCGNGYGGHVLTDCEFPNLCDDSTFDPCAELGSLWCQYMGWPYSWYQTAPLMHTCGETVDYRSDQQKAAGCCPLPLEGSGSEDPTKEEGEPDCEESVGNPVNVATGNKFEKALDLSVSTPGIPLEFRRFYNGRIIFGAPLGNGWTHTYDLLLQVLQTSPTKRVRIWDSDGKALYFNEVQQSPTEILFGGESGVKDRLREVISTGEYILRRKQGNLTYVFDADGKLLTISDPNGNTIALTYTGGLLTEVSNNFGKSISIQYNGGRITSVTDPKGQSVFYEHTDGDLTKVTYPDQNLTTYAYCNHRLTDKYDTNNNLTGHWEYDNNGRVITYYSHIKEGIPQERIDLFYQAGGTVLTRSTGTTNYSTAVIDGIRRVQGVEGCSTCGTGNKQYIYSERGDLTQVTSIDETNQYTTQYTYDNAINPWEQIGEILTMTEALGWAEQRTTSYTSTHRTDDPFLLTQSTENIKSVVDPQQNKVTTTSYDNQGNILSRQESGFVFINGVPTPKTYTTQYQYNTFGQLTQVDGPRTDVSDITTYEYYDNALGEGNNRGQLKAIVNAMGQRTQYSDYDANGNVGRITDPNNVVSQATYDQRNRIRTVTNLSTGAQSQYFYDARGNPDHVILPEGNRIEFDHNLANKVIEIRDDVGNKIQYQYDTEGNRTREETRDPQGTLKRYLDFIYDSNNNLSRIINPDGSYTEYTYDGRSNLTSMKDPRNKETNFSYDSLNRLKQMTQPLSTITSYSYDTQNNHSSITDPKGNPTQYSHDDFGRKNQTISPDTGVTDYLYDEAGNLIERFDAKETVVNYTYDALNRLTGIRFPGDPTQNVAFTYDSTQVSNGIGRLTGRIDASGTYVFHYDTHGNLTREEKAINSIQYTTEYAYDGNNILTSITYPTGRTITYVPDQAGRILRVDTTVNGNPKTLASNVFYLPFGGITDLTYGNGLTLVQEYDNQYRISSILVGWLINVGYEYDPNGNIISIMDYLNPLEDQPNDDLAGYTYQQGTNRLAHITGALPADFGYDANGNITSENTWTYIYDLSNQLIRVLDGTDQIAEYAYNGAGQRMMKVVPSGTTIFHYDRAGHIIAETNQTGQMIGEYVYLGDQLLSMIKPGELVYYFHNDHLGKPQVLTDDIQAVAWKAAYTPFGQAAISFETVENPFRFPGQYYDQETGLHYNYFRYYDPTTGRYVTPDPLGLEGGINLFAYVQNNPGGLFDPFGLFSTEDFIKHYYFGGGRSIDLAAVGLLDGFKNSQSVQIATNDFRLDVRNAAKQKATTVCGKCDKVKTVTFPLNSKTTTNVTNEPDLFAVGESTFFRSTTCSLTVNCKNKTYSYTCSLIFSIRDWFRDPLSVGIELGGKPYPIIAFWRETIRGSGGF